MITTGKNGLKNPNVPVMAKKMIDRAKNAV